MKRKSGNDHADVMRQQRFPLPGTDLGYLNAQPMDFVPDVDLAACGHPEGRCICGHEGHHYDWEDGHAGHMGQHSFAVPKYAKKWEI